MNKKASSEETHDFLLRNFLSEEQSLFKIQPVFQKDYVTFPDHIIVSDDSDTSFVDQILRDARKVNQENLMYYEEHIRNLYEMWMRDYNEVFGNSIVKTKPEEPKL